jgi:hypothetical protein
MSRRFPSFARLLGLSALLMGLVIGCDGSKPPGPTPPAPKPRPDAERSTVEVSRASDVLADGQDASAITVTVRDTDGAVMKGLQVQLEVSGEGATLTPAQGTTDASGLVKAALTATTPGVKTLQVKVQAEGGLVALASRPTVTFKPRPAAKLAFSSAALSAVAGGPVGPVLEVAIQDATGQLVPGATHEVTLALGTHPQGAVLAGTLRARAVNGVARFSEVVLKQAGVGYTLVASAQGLTGATSAAFDVAPASVGAMNLLLSARSVTAGGTVDATVELADAFGNRATNYRGTVTLVSSDSTAPLAVTEYTFTEADAGRHTFPGLVFQRAGTATLTVTDKALGAQLQRTGEVEVLPGAAAKLAFTQQPANQSVGKPLATVRVTLTDAFGNTVAVNAPAVTVALQGGSATLGGVTTVAPAEGVASFTQLTVGTEGTGYTLAASAPGLTGSTSAPFTIVDDVPPASPVLQQGATTVSSIDVEWDAVGDDGLVGRATAYELRYATTNIVTDADFAAATRVATGAPLAAGAREKVTLGELAMGTTYYVALKVTDNLGNAVRSATLMASTQNRQVTRLAFTQQPVDGTAGEALADIRVALQDADGNTVTSSTAAVTLTLQADAAITQTVAAVQGVATFSGLRIDRAGSNHAFVATSGALPSLRSDAFAIRPAAASRLDLVGLVGPVSAGVESIVEVIAYDAFDNVATGYRGTVHFTSTDGKATLPADQAFRDVDLGRKQLNVTLKTAGRQSVTVEAGALTDSLSVDVGSGAADLLEVSSLPTSVTAGEAQALTVTARDVHGNIVTGYRGTVAFTSTDREAVLPEATPFSVDDKGQKTFQVTFRTAAASASVTVTDLARESLTATTSTRVAPGAATRLVLSAPASATAGAPFTVTVTALDALGNQATGYTGTVRFFASGSGFDLPAPEAFTDLDQGRKSFPGVVVRIAGDTDVTVTDTEAPTLSDTASVEVVAGAPARLAFTAQPPERVRVRAELPEVRVTLLDAFDNVTNVSSPAVTLALNGDASATLSGTRTVAPSNGVASFTGLSVDVDGTGYRLTASASGLPSVTSTLFDVVDDVAPAKPLLVAGATTVNSIAIEWDAVGDDDALGRAKAYELRYATTDIVTDEDFAKATLVPTGAPQAPGTRESVTLTGLTPATTYFVALKVTDDAGNAIRSATLMASTQDRLVTQLAFTQQPVNGTAGEALADIRVALQDADGNTVASSTSAVTLTLKQDASITKTVAAIAGVATFSGLRVDKAGSNYAFEATSGVLPAVQSGPFAIQPAAASKLELEGLAEAVTAGAQSSFEVVAYDAFGNVATGYQGSVHFTSTDEAAQLPADAALAQGRMQFNVTFKTAGRRSVTVTDKVLNTLSDTASVDVAAGTPVKLAFTSQPQNGRVRTALAQVQVTLRDAFDNVADVSTPSVTLALNGNASATLSGTRTVAPSNGVATFTGLSVDADGTGYTLTASASGLPDLTSTAFNIVDDVAPARPVLVATGTAAKSITVEWNAVGDDDALGTATAYELRYATTDIVTDADFAAAMLVATGTPQAPGARESATLSGLTPVTTYYVALKVTDNVGNAVRSLTRTVSTTAADVTQLAFTQQPVNGTAGEALADIRVALRDVDGNTVTTATSAVTLTLKQDASITKTVNAVAGVATFSGLRVDKAGSNYAFEATSGVLPAVQSGSFAIQPAAASKLELEGLAEAVTAGAQSSFEVVAYDAFNNVATGYQGSVHFTSTDEAAQLPMDAALAQGRMQFNVTFKTAGRRALTVTDKVAPTLSDTASVDVAAGTPVKLAFTSQPQNGRVRTALAQVQVTLRDAFDNVADVSTPSVTLALNGNASATLSGTRTVAPSNGVATFTGLSVDADGAGYTLTASASGLPDLTSTAFNIVDDVTPAKPVLLAGATTRTSIAIEWNAVGDDDALGTATAYELRYASTNIVTDADFAAATLVATGAPQAPGTREGVTLTGLAQASTYYVALKVTDNAGNTVRSATLMASTQDAQVERLFFVQQPVNGTAGEALADVRVALQDADGNTAITATSAVTLTLSTDASYTVTVSAVNGVATFSGLTVNRAGTGFTFQATSGALPTVASSPFDIRPAAAASLSVTGLPGSITAGSAQTVTVAAYDAFGNRATGYRGTVHFTSKDTQAVLPASYTFRDTDQGQKDFPVTLKTVGTQNVVVTDSHSGMRAETITEVVPGAAAGFALTAPATVTAGQAAQVIVTAMDAFGNVATGYMGMVHFTSTDGAAVLPVDSGFSDVDRGRKAFSVTLKTAGPRDVQVQDTEDDALAGLQTVTVTPAAPARLVLSGGAGPFQVGTAFSVEVRALDAFGNVATGYTGRVHFTSSDEDALLPAPHVFSTTNDKGVRVFSGLTLGLAGTQTLTVRDDDGLSSSLTVELEPGSAASLQLVASSSGPYVAGQTVSVEVVLRDAYANVATGYTGTVHFDSTDSAATLPADFTFSAAHDKGRRSFDVTFVTAGFVTLTVTDNTPVVALTASIDATIKAAEPAKLAFLAQPSQVGVHEPLPMLQVEVQDAYGNGVPTATPVVNLTLVGGNPAASLQGTATASSVEGVATFTGLSLDQEGTGFTLTATAAGLMSVVSTPFTIVDNQPPSAPTLVSDIVTDSSITLSWIAVGDDNELGTASGYELRYSTQPITTAAEWAAAQPVPTPAPVPAGGSMSVTVTGLNPGTTYSFALEVRDSAGNTVRAFADVTTDVPEDPCATIVCEPSATCTADARSVVTTTSTCVVSEGAGVCQPSAPTTTRCAVGEVCFDGACAPVTGNDQAGGVVITEFRALGGEFIELHNATGSDLDLRGFTFENAAGQQVAIRAISDLDGTAGTAVTLPSGGYLHGVANPANGVVPAGVGFVYGAPGTDFALADTGDVLVLSGRDGVIEDLVDFRSFVTDANQPLTDSDFVGFAGISTQLHGASLDAADNDAPENWCGSFYPASGQRRKVADTAGAANGSCHVLVLNEVVIDADGANADDGKAFIELAGPAGARVEGVSITDIEGGGVAAGNRNQDTDRATGETDGIFVLPEDARIPADGLLLVADGLVDGSTSVPHVTPGVDVIARDIDMENGGGDSIQLIAADGTLLDALGTDATGAALAKNVASNGLAMYETATALYSPSNSSLARSSTSLDTDDNRADFHGDPTPTPGQPNDMVKVTVTGISPRNGLASVSTPNVVITGTDLAIGSTVNFGGTAVAGCNVSLDATTITCTAPTNATAAVVDVSVTSSPSIIATPVTLPGAFTFTGVMNETDSDNEVDYCNLQHPPTLTATQGQRTELIYGQLYQAGLTDAFGGQAPGIKAEVGYGPLSSNPTANGNWRFFPADFNEEKGNNDEYQGSFIAPAVTAQTQFSYTLRLSLDNGLNWTYCDKNGAGANGGLFFNATELGVLTVNP